MALASGWSGGHYGGTSSTSSTTNKITKGRGNRMVKPILKKLSHSEKNSLDLDREWGDQHHTWAGSGMDVSGSGAAGGGFDSPIMRSARDVSFVSANFAADTGGSRLGGRSGGCSGAGPGGSSSGIGSEIGSLGGVGSGAVGSDATSLKSVGVGVLGRPQFQHGRSSSGASHISVATSGSGGGPGSRGAMFVHPFQQTPRTATPPLSYANSLASFDNGIIGGSSANAGAASGRDYSPTITENEDDDDDGYSLSLPLNRPSGSTAHLAHSHPANPASLSSPSHPKSHSLSGAASSSKANPHSHSQSYYSSKSNSNPSSNPPIPYPQLHSAHSLSQSSLRRPSLASQRTASFSETNNPSPSSSPAVSTALQQQQQQQQQQTQTSGGRLINNPNRSRLAKGSSALSSGRSHSDLAISLNSSGTEDDSSPNTKLGASRSQSLGPLTALSIPSAPFTSPPSSGSTAMSPIRSSLEAVGGLGPRLRALSEQTDRRRGGGSHSGAPLDPNEHAQMMREARAKFEEKERAKNEKFERENLKKLQKLAKREMQQHRHGRSSFRSTPVGSAPASFEIPRPSTTASSIDWRKRHGPNGGGGEEATGGGSGTSNNEKAGGFSSSNYDNIPHGMEPAHAAASASFPVHHQRRRGSASAKRKTHGYWTSVILWIRTKIFKLSRGD